MNEKRNRSKVSGTKNDRLTIYDIAQELHISIATVSRALNGKEDVSDETRKRIMEAAREMGYKASRSASSLSRKEKRFAVLFPDLIHDYNNEIRRGIEKEVEDLSEYHLSVDMLTIQGDPEMFASKIRELSAQGYDGVMILSSVGEARLSELLREMKLSRMAVATVTTDLDRDVRVFNVQSNGKVAGRMAGELLSLLTGPGAKTALVTGQLTSQVHKSTAEGFLEEAGRQGLAVAGIYEHYDQPAKAYECAEKMIREHPDLEGIYLATANSVTFCNRLAELGYAGKIKLVASDIFPKMIEFIRSGLVYATIFQNPFDQGRLATRYLFEHLVEGREFGGNRILLDPQIVIRSNLELYEKKLLDVMSEDVLF
mgnify:CR=1 FL=1